MYDDLLQRITNDVARLTTRLTSDCSKSGLDAAGCDDIISLCKEAQGALTGVLAEDFTHAAFQRLLTHYFLRLNEAGLLVENALHRGGGCADNMPGTDLLRWLAALARQLHPYLPSTLPSEQLVFQAYSRLFIHSLGPQIRHIRQLLQSAAIDRELAELLRTYIDHMSRSGLTLQQTHRALLYFETWLNSLCTLDPENDDKEEILLQELLRHNFNYLPLIRYWQRHTQHILQDLPVMRKRNCLNNLLRQMKEGMEAGATPFDPRWPSLDHILAGWLEEEIEIAGAGEKVIIQKFPLSIPVAQLGCLLKVYFEESAGNCTAAELIRWAAAHFTTKRQSDISPRSLSKEFYSTDQFTAARVREKLLHMAGSISAKYFPVIAAAVIAGRVLLNNH